MRDSAGLGFGGFLLGLGGGYLVFKEYNLPTNGLAWVLLIIGMAVVLTAILQWVSPGLHLNKVMSGTAGGLILALFLTQGVTFLQGLGGIGNVNQPYSTMEQKIYTGASTQGIVELKLGGINGPITVSTWDKQEYLIDATITARGATQREADDNLSKLVKELVKDDAQSLQKLNLVYTSPILLNNPYRITIEVKLPSSTKLNLDVSTSNGAIYLSNIPGNGVSLRTSNGQIILTNVKAESLICTTSNAAITGNIEAKDTRIETSNAHIELKIPGTSSGSYRISTSNAAVDVTVGDGADYKLDASTSNAEVTFNLSNLTYTKDTKTSKTAKTNGYDLAQIKIDVTISTSNGRIEVDRSTSGI